MLQLFLVISRYFQSPDISASQDILFWAISRADAKRPNQSSDGTRIMSQKSINKSPSFPFTADWPLEFMEVLKAGRVMPTLGVRKTTPKEGAEAPNDANFRKPVLLWAKRTP